ncbi:MAG: hypothetical protein ACI970_000895, partial [Myxococcota bacterium]
RPALGVGPACLHLDDDHKPRHVVQRDDVKLSPDLTGPHAPVALGHVEAVVVNQMRDGEPFTNDPQRVVRSAR